MPKDYAEIVTIVKAEISLLLLVNTKKENFMQKEFVKLVIWDFFNTKNKVKKGKGQITKKKNP